MCWVIKLLAEAVLILSRTQLCPIIYADITLEHGNNKSFMASTPWKLMHQMIEALVVPESTVATKASLLSES